MHLKGFHQPKPIQKPFPPIMNAGSSATGARFAAKYADMVFTTSQPRYARRDRCRGMQHYVMYTATNPVRFERL